MIYYSATRNKIKPKNQNKIHLTQRARTVQVTLSHHNLIFLNLSTTWKLKEEKITCK